MGDPDKGAHPTSARRTRKFLHDNEAEKFDLRLFYLTGTHINVVRS